MASAEVGTPTADENDDNWLYGDSNSDQAQNKDEDKTQESVAPETTTPQEDEEEKETEENDAVNDDEHFEDAANGDGDSQENGDSDSDDSDDVKVTIGEIKTVPQTYAIKRVPGLVTGVIEKPRVITATSAGKVTLEDLEGPGSINGVPAVEYNIDTIEDKPWNKPGADISDYFNYGFNEITWSSYCEKQRKMRMNESGVNIHVAPQRPVVQEMRPRAPAQMNRNEEMHQGPPVHQYQHQSLSQPQENTIQVMTADRRDYGRRDMAPEFFPPHDPYFNGQPTHGSYDNTWGQPPPSNWTPSDIKELTPGPGQLGAPMGMAPSIPSHMSQHLAVPAYSGPFRHGSHHDRDRDRERDRDRIREREERDRRERDRDRDRDRHDEDRDRDRERERERSRTVKPERSREKSYRRERSRSRSRRHKSRSRSPRQRERDRDRSTKPKKESKEKEEDK